MPNFGTATRHTWCCAFRLDNLEDQISTLLGTKVRLFVPSCVMRELRDMAKTDKAYQAVVALARKFACHKDACPPTETTSDILLQQIGNISPLCSIHAPSEHPRESVIHIPAVRASRAMPEHPPHLGLKG